MMREYIEDMRPAFGTYETVFGGYAAFSPEKRLRADRFQRILERGLDSKPWYKRRTPAVPPQTHKPEQHMEWPKEAFDLNKSASWRRLCGMNPQGMQKKAAVPLAVAAKGAWLGLKALAKPLAGLFGAGAAKAMPLAKGISYPAAQAAVAKGLPLSASQMSSATSLSSLPAWSTAMPSAATAGAKAGLMSYAWPLASHGLSAMAIAPGIVQGVGGLGSGDWRQTASGFGRAALGAGAFYGIHKPLVAGGLAAAGKPYAASLVRQHGIHGALGAHAGRHIGGGIGAQAMGSGQATVGQAARMYQSGQKWGSGIAGTGMFFTTYPMASKAISGIAHGGQQAQQMQQAMPAMNYPVAQGATQAAMQYQQPMY